MRKPYWSAIETSGLLSSWLPSYLLIMPCYVKLWMLEDRRRYNMALIWSWHGGGLHQGLPVIFKNKITQDIKHSFRHLAMILVLGFQPFFKSISFQGDTTILFSWLSKWRKYGCKIISQCYLKLCWDSQHFRFKKRQCT